ncbi:hypothetical protein [Flavobacterium cerinum]|uniref:Serine protease n=1 Tax=Flavobacterium cerinum TaxID=2502784 RepID=A0A3S3QE76_9FLAO|nr:hypothetical protein [Flavobacterium cerinum]RWX02271.1 hypothetical protein EPI11_03375 [Flavobacterium cerinum]
MEVEVSDKLIAVTTMLFILSMISERIITFIKLWCVKGRSFLFIVVSDDVDTSIRAVNPAEEAKRSRSILAINLTVSFLIALLSKASLFDMFSFSDAHPEIWNNLFSWQNETFSFSFESVARLLSIIFGCALTGSFISLGSKFWHDLLDLLLQVKDLKKNLNEQAGTGLKLGERANEIKQEKEVIKAAISPYKKQLIQIENIVKVLTNDSGEETILEVYVKGDFDAQLIPKAIFYKDLHNKEKSIRVEILKGANPEIQSDLWPADAIANIWPYKGNTGSNGGKVYDKTTGEEYFMTCFHVVKSPSHNWSDKYPNTDISIKNIDNGTICGTIKFTCRNTKVDVSIVKPNEKTNLKSTIPGIGTPYFSRNIGGDDVAYKTKVKKYGVTTKFTEGYIFDDDAPVEISYLDGSSVIFNSLIIIKSLHTERFSDKGDSGSFIIDEYNYLIGMLVGGSGDKSYVMRINEIFDITNTKINRL